MKKQFWYGNDIIEVYLQLGLVGKLLLLFSYLHKVKYERPGQNWALCQPKFGIRVNDNPAISKVDRFTHFIIFG